MAVDLTAFRSAFPRYQHCTDEVLTFWDDIAGCLFCAPVGCSALQAKIPMLMLDHVLSVNAISCPAPTTTTTTGTGTTTTTTTTSDACTCDDDLINQLLNDGAKIKSVDIEGVKVSFDNAGVTTTASTAVSGSAGSSFTAWLSLSRSGKMIAAMLTSLYKGPTMAIGQSRAPGVYGDGILGHLRR